MWYIGCKCHLDDIFGGKINTFAILKKIMVSLYESI